MHRQLGPISGGLLASLHPTGGASSAPLATDGGGSSAATDGGGRTARVKSAVVIDAIARTQAAIVRDTDRNRTSGTRDEVRGAVRRGGGNGSVSPTFRRRDPDVRIELATTSLLGRLHFDQGSVIHRAGRKTLTLIDVYGPATEDLCKWQADAVADRADRRADRMPEIYVQIDDLWPFWQALTHIEPLGAPRTFELLRVALQFVTRVVMQLKQTVDCPRPSEVNQLIIPVIEVPGHGSLPSGHATSAYMLSGVMAGLLGLRHRPTHLMSDLLKRLAFRVAHNREVAGVHYPMDSAAGRVLGTVLAEYFCTSAQYDEHARGIFKGAEFDPRDWTADDSRKIVSANEDSQLDKLVPGIAFGKEAELGVADPYLAVMWADAFEELSEQGLIYGDPEEPDGGTE